VFTHLDIDSCG